MMVMAQEHRGAQARHILSRRLVESPTQAHRCRLEKIVVQVSQTCQWPPYRMPRRMSSVLNASGVVNVIDGMPSFSAARVLRGWSSMNSAWCGLMFSRDNAIW